MDPGVSAMELQLLPAKRVQPASPPLGMIHIPHQNIREAYTNFSFYTHLTSFEAIEVLHRLRVECLRMTKQGLLKHDGLKSCRVEEFQHLHTSSIHAFSTFASEVWPAAIKNHVKTCFKDIGKGWYNMNESDKGVYGFSKMKRLLKLIGMVMNDVLRSTVRDGLQSYCASVEAATADRVVVFSLTKIDVKRDDDVRARKYPMFTVDVVFKSVTTKVEYGGGRCCVFACVTCVLGSCFVCGWVRLRSQRTRASL
jgi:dynein heavy chain, axonemal